MITWQRMAEINAARGARIVCTLGVGCEESGVCYASAHGDPDKCGINVVDVDTAKEAVVDYEQCQLANKDAEQLGTGYLVDGKRVMPSRVTMIRKVHWPHVTTAELWSSLEQVLRDKGASDEWIAYAMGDLQLAATQYASAAYALGHRDASQGKPLPNPQLEEPSVGFDLGRECLLSDLHRDLHRGERCPECNYCDQSDKRDYSRMDGT